LNDVLISSHGTEYRPSSPVDPIGKLFHLIGKLIPALDADLEISLAHAMSYPYGCFYHSMEEE
jgi:hypothetical protein